ncbi:hypothetical protein C4D60_Mb02t03230 [Musa balbisiana]|uniref:Wound-responsive family protein n=1 Tax=Musa balbisiana TaxID=52838 RepID=A0A4S8I7Y9_MUSBA|nr:hypothetical protein C4D60_Mb02t03230 [Musa balbisiana]
MVIDSTGIKSQKTPQHILWSAISESSAESLISRTHGWPSASNHDSLCFREASLSSGPYITLPSLASHQTSQDPYKPSSITIILDWTRSSQEEREREKESERMGSRSKASLVVAASLAAVETLKDQAGLCRWNYMLRSLYQRAKNSSGGTGQFPQAKLTIPSDIIVN